MTDQPTQVELTKEGLAKLNEELKDLVEVKLPANVERVALAREKGDLSENADYQDGKSQQTLLETRIMELEQIIGSAKIVKHTKSHQKVGIGSSVVLSMVGKKNKTTYQIVGEFEANPGEKKISSVSPMGRAIMGKKKGGTFKVTVPAGEVEYKVVDIK